MSQNSIRVLVQFVHILGMKKRKRNEDDTKARGPSLTKIRTVLTLRVPLQHDPTRQVKAFNAQIPS